MHLRTIFLLSVLWLIMPHLAQAGLVDEVFTEAANGSASMTYAQFEGFYLDFLAGHHGEHEHGGPPEPDCPTANATFTKHNIDAVQTMNITEFSAALDDIVALRASGCILRDEAKECKEKKSKAWGYSILATVIVSITSLIGATVLLSLKAIPSLRTWLLDFLVAFGAGALISDPILHILPEVWGVHSHGAEGEEPSEREHLWLGCVVLLSVVAFFLVEKIIEKYLLHSAHSHFGETEMTETSHSHSSGKLTDKLPEDGSTSSTPSVGKSVGYMNLIADAVHNFCDGIAIGAAFALKASVGLSTSIAVVVHEIPQELGDFALLLEAGFTWWQALLFNLLSSALAIVGAIIGVGVGSSSESAEKYLLCIAAGSFFYIAFSNLIPVLGKRKGNIWAISALHTVGMCLGFVVLLLIALYEPESEC